VQTIDTFPQLERYQGYWPINDIMMMHLKNTSRRERLKVAKLLTAKSARNHSKSGKKDIVQ
jgi:hypothetical protein